MRTKLIFIIILFVLFIDASFGQVSNKKITVSGIVKDAQNYPIAGAYIFVDNNNTKVSTNDKGFYKIRVPADADSISVITTIYGICETAINGRTSINFIFAESPDPWANGLNNTAVDELLDIGYGTIGQNNLTNSVNSVNGNNQKYDSYGSIHDMLKSTPGVQVIPGDGFKEDRIILQGQSSTSHLTEPMFVVDGMPRESINDILPSMVNNISILKGSSAAIYGSRGAYGVILINLKRTP